MKRQLFLIFASLTTITLSACDRTNRVAAADPPPSGDSPAEAVTTAPPESPSPESREPESTPESTAEPTETKDGTLKIKGLYIGMKISEARDIFNSGFADTIGDKLAIVKDPDGGLLLRPDKPDAANPMNMMMEAMARLPVPLVKADADGTVNYFAIPASLGDKMFNTTDLDADSFAQKFIDSYGIPELKTFEKESGFGNVHNTEQGWEYTSPAGFKLRIHSDKSIELETAPKESERKFD